LAGPKAAALKDAVAGSVLIGVNGELLSVENYERLMAKVKEWTSPEEPAPTSAAPLPVGEPSTSTEGASTPEPVPAPDAPPSDGEAAAPAAEGEGEAGGSGSGSGSEEGAPAPAIPPIAAPETLHLTFRLPSVKVEQEEVFPVAVGAFREKARSDEDEKEGHRQQVAAMKQKVGDPDIPDVLFEHFLTLSKWDSAQAYEQVRMM
jgi:hypothetical protein